ncbi:MAG: recombinase family protein [Mycobacterium sp.]
MTGAAPSGVVTFLFTDVEGSTRRWETDAEAMRAALATHDKVLRSAIETHGGFMFKHTGDGVCAAFASPRSAVDTAIAAQRKLELPVRMGIATGEAELREGDYFGAVLNRAARVMAAGHGGQILLVESTASLLSGVDLLDLGPRRLRDLSTPIGVFQVRAAGLRTEFPALRALDASPGNLRAATTSFIGRESEVAELQAAVKAHRLVTLTGVGGVGKTRLALEVAARRADEFPDGVWFFELAAVTDPAAVPDAVAAVLGITQQPGKTVTESVASALEGRLRLLVFDNCEHVVDSVADLVEAILAASPTVTILATSREGVGVSQEQLWRVPSLDVNAGTESAAVNLFVDRAHSVVSDFSLAQPGEADAVVEICRRLDGIPLAIELAASRMASMTVGEVRDRLDQRFRLLVGSRRGLERHQTLRQAVVWSYDLLDDTGKVLLERCSVFAGGFDLESACAVMGSDDDFAALDLLDALVRKSLLVADRSSGRTRFSMLETIRQFAEEQLVARGEASEIRAAHSRYFAGREADIMALWDSPRQRDAYDWFTVELANLRIAFRWAADQGDLDVAAPIASYAGWLGVGVQTLEPIAWAEELIEPARTVDHPRLAFLYVSHVDEKDIRPNTGTRIGYTRVSTVAQTLEQQQAALNAAGVVKTFSDTMSGTRDDRPGLAGLLAYVREGDSVVVWKLDRLGRNLQHILATVKALTDRGVTLVSTSDGIDSSTAAGRMMIGVLGSLAEYERELIKERTALKRTASRANGTKFGRPRKVDDSEHITTAKRMKADGHTGKDIAKYLGVSRATVYRYFGDEVVA